MNFPQKNMYRHQKKIGSWHHQVNHVSTNHVIMRHDIDMILGISYKEHDHNNVRHELFSWNPQSD